MHATIEPTVLTASSNFCRVKFAHRRRREQTVGDADVNPAVLSVSAALEAKQHAATAPVITDACNEATSSVVLALERGEIEFAPVLYNDDKLWVLRASCYRKRNPNRDN